MKQFTRSAHPVMAVLSWVRVHGNLGLVLSSFILLSGCTIEVLAPETEPHEHSEEEEPFIELEVVRSTNTYWSDELDIFDNRLALDCIRFKIREEWLQVAEGHIWLFTYEGWNCFDHPDVVDVYNAKAAVFYTDPPFGFDPFAKR